MIQQQTINIETLTDDSEIIHYDRSNIPLYIRTGKLSFYPHRKALCHWHDDIEIIHILKGSMNYYIDGTKIFLRENDGLIVNTRRMHYGYSVNGMDCDFTCILFHPNLFSGNKVLYQNYVTPVLENKSLDYLLLDAANPASRPALTWIADISHIKTAAKSHYLFEITGLLYRLWIPLYEYSLKLAESTEKDTTSDISIQKNMVSFIAQHYYENLSLADIANAGNVCRSKCCKIFKSYLGESPIDFVNAYRLKVSCLQLTSTDKKISEIALLCGFNHLSYFSELFSRSYNCTPSEYRRKNRSS